VKLVNDEFIKEKFHGLYFHLLLLT